MELYLVIEGEYDDKDPHSIHSSIAAALTCVHAECAVNKNIYTIYKMQLDSSETPYQNLGWAVWNYDTKTVVWQDNY